MPGNYREEVVTGETSPLARQLLDDVVPAQLLVVPIEDHAAALQCSPRSGRGMMHGVRRLPHRAYQVSTSDAAMVPATFTASAVGAQPCPRLALGKTVKTARQRAKLQSLA